MKKIDQKAGKNRGKKLMVCGAVLASLAAGLLSGCGCGSILTDEDSITAADSTVTGTNTFVYDDEDAEAPVSTTLYAVVTAVDGSEITLATSDTDFTAVSGTADIGGGMMDRDGTDGNTMGKGSSDGRGGGRSDDSADDAASPDGAGSGAGSDSATDPEDSTDSSSEEMTVNSLGTTDTSNTATADSLSSADGAADISSDSPDFGGLGEAPDGMGDASGDMGEALDGAGEMPGGMGNMPGGISKVSSDTSDVPDDVPDDMGEMPDSTGGMGGDAPSGDMSEMGEMPTNEDGDMEMPTNEDGEMEMPTDEDGETRDFSDGGMTGGKGDMDIADIGTAGFSVETATLTIGDESVILVEIESEDAGTSDGEASNGTEDTEDADSENTDSENTEDADSDSEDSSEAENYVSGSLEDITVGAVLEIGFDENGDITFILVTTQTIDTDMLESWLESSDSTEDGDSSDDDSNSSGGDVSNGGFGGGSNGGSMGGSSDSSSISYEAVTEYTETTEADGESYESSGTDENAILVATADAVVTLNNITVSRISSNSTGGDNSSFYGVGAAVLATSGTLIIDHAVIDTDAAGGAGVFSYGDALVYVSDSTITTEQDTSGGIHVAGGGTLYAWDLTVETSGESSAAIRSDRGGGTMVVDGGTYTSNGTGSPAVYCTADIAVANATLIANGSEAFCMEGLNTALLFDCDITGNMSDSSQNDTTWTFIVYQSMSGDSEVGVGCLQIIGGSITSENGGMFYTTNTESEILISDVDITYADDSEFFLMCTGNANERGWGSTGSNGADCIFTAIDQEMEGDVIWDSISTLEFYMEDGSTLTGSFVDDESWAGNGGSGYANVYISSDSAWIVTGDSTVTYLYNAGTITDVDGNTVSIVGSDGTVYVSGTSDYTITVDSYESTTDTVITFDGALTAESWENYEVEEP